MSHLSLWMWICGWLFPLSPVIECCMLHGATLIKIHIGRIGNLDSNRHSDTGSDSDSNSNRNKVAAYKLSTAKQGSNCGKPRAGQTCSLLQAVWLKQMLNVWNCSKVACDMWQYPWHTHTHIHTRRQWPYLFGQKLMMWLKAEAGF